MTLSRSLALSVALAASGLAGCNDGEPAFLLEDSGTNTGPRKDTGTGTPIDAGTQQNGDTGVNPPADTGVNTPADTGVNTPADTGVIGPPADTGVIGPPADSGMIVIGNDAGNNTGNDAGNNTGNDAGNTMTADTGVAMGGFNPANLGATLAQAICQHRTRCEPARHDYLTQSEMQCIGEQTTEITAFLSAMVDPVNAGATTFDQAIFNSCINAYQNADCELGLDQGACRYLLGSKGMNEGCGFHQECSMGLYCQRPALGSCGACASRAAVGESCIGSASCGEDARCLEVQNGNFVCVRVTVGEGQACGTVGTGLCRGELQCVTNGMTATCMRPAASGAACTPNGQGGPGCNILNNLGCIGGNCTPVTWNGPGVACTPPAFCNVNASCDSGNMTCQQLPGAGTACLDGRCATGTYCDGMMCQARQMAGAACENSGQCAPPLECLGAPGAQVCAQLVWPQCGNPGADAGVSTDAGNAPADAGMANPDAGVVGMDAGGGGNTFTPATHANQIAGAVCGFTQRCEPARLLFGAQTQAQCATEQETNFASQFAAIGDAITAGRISFTQSEFDTCMMALANADCDVGVAPGACDFFSGTRGQGQGCQLTGECGAGLFCAAQGVAICGACEPRAAMGTSCANAPCGDGAGCVEVGQPGNFLCVPVTANVNDPCGTLPTGLCRGELQCIADPFGSLTCQRPAQTGQQCSTQGQTPPNCSILQNNGCISGTCQVLSWNTPGAVCGGSNACDITGTCDTTNSTCVARPPAGAPCVNNSCAPGAYCDNNQCRAEITNGNACTASAQCVDPLLCVGATGSRTCGALAFTLCN